MDLNSEKRVVAQAKLRKKAFTRLYLEYKDKIHNYILKKVNRPDVADDLTSVTFEKALRKIHSFQWLGVSFGSWLFRIARNTVYDYYRASKKKPLSLEEDFVEGAASENNEARLLHDETELTLFAVIADFPKQDQFLLYYKYFENMSTDEIAGLTRLTESNVATRLHRLRSRMKKILENVRQ